ncbi:hypothetical protein TBLA_0E01290 [Henningerozyma blattae CBS 6284]|uniref:Telomerase reverse transcriptase n=1 Tax=Henningerozyma blattae (strain ATCC 34711 / CBS 6284 / DSM 70876 / NBRC 10599 / NRRL Y-10934 / UCD 77-7) TaxID=1071380 RepID=I2H487_HENB6|nr:hypothetical protein TBLA_0E01290 [Tetrapisispora blattae CBS 6284]CCH61189.1 hypothetical protein TBLA_0E01290 [Tetrapisispora blattae CBS 6284]
MESLYSFLTSLDDSKIDSLETYNDFSFFEFLNTHFIVKNSNVLTLPINISITSNFVDTINQCITFLLDKKLFNNLLTFGYKFTQNTSELLSNKSINTNVHILKSVNWKILFNAIKDPLVFMDLLLNYSVFHFNYNLNCYIQIVGNKLNRPHSPPTWVLKKSHKNDLSTKHISLRYASFRDRHFNELKNLLKRTQCIFPSDLLSTLPSSVKYSIELNYKSIYKNFNSILKQNLPIKFLNKFCPKQSYNYHLENATPSKDVVRFIILLLEKLIPQKLFGSKKNKSIIFSNLSSFISLPIGGSISISDVMMNIQVTKFSWLHKLSSSSLNDFQLLTNLVHHFVYWLFTFLISNLISIHFYATNVSSKVEILYFRQDTWHSISKSFIKSYFMKYLLRSPFTSILSDNSNLENASKLRIIPKSANGEFRVLSTPYRSTNSNIIYHSLKKPVILILKYLRTKRETRYRRIQSVNEIPLAIQYFKSKLEKKFDKSLPAIYFMKFDMDSCYDSIPRTKLISILDDLLSKEDGFHLRSQTIYNYQTNKSKISYSINETLQGTPNDILVDNVLTKYYSNSDVRRLVYDEIFQTTMYYKNRPYIRKDGLFQGSHFSGLLVDILYDDLLESYDVFHCNTTNDERLLLRIADDFLVMSTNKKQIEEINQVAREGFMEYNASVKLEKILNLSSQEYAETNKDTTIFQFCGLNINFCNLNVWKESTSLNILQVNSSSIKTIYKRLKWIFQIRLSYNTLNMEINNNDTICLQIKIIIENISKILINSLQNNKNNNTRNNEIKMKYFLNFINYTIESTNNVTNMNYKNVIIHEFIRNFLPNQSKFSKEIKCLNNIV